MKRWGHWVGLFLLSVLLATCAPPASAVVGRLLNERSQVFWRGSGQPAQELAAGATLGVAVGDEVWTQSQGRALLKFLDLWLRLYDDTTLHADDVTPASIKLALGQGATLVGKAPVAGAGVEITVGDPPTARIVLAGTLLMIAQPMRDGPTVVRLFAGAAQLTALRREQTQVLRAGEWGVVEPDGQIRRPGDAEMRQLAKELGWWNQFSEIERDAAGSSSTEEPVRLVFVTETPAARPNLVARIVKAPGKATCGQQLGDSVVVHVANTGQADAGGFFLSLYLSEDEKVTSQDMRLSSPLRDGLTPTLRVSPLSSITFVEGLAAGQSLEVGLRGANPIPTALPQGTRTYWLGIIVEGADEADRVAAPPWPITIGCAGVVK